MSIKDLFDKGHSLKFVKNKTQDDIREDVESSRYVSARVESRDRFVPNVDFATASNFARFGLAEEYYDSSIKRIYQTYPYDGSQAEKIEWENESTYLDLFIFENEYPRTTGYVTIGQESTFDGTKDANSNVYLSTSPEYIFIKGGPHADPGEDYKSEFSAGNSYAGVSKANIYHTGTQRTNNLELDLGKGVTVEFWMKKSGWASESEEHHEYLFHSWNSGSSESSGSLRAYIYGETSDSKSTITVSAISGATEISFDHDTGLTNIADDNWHHYAFTLKTMDTSTVSNLYVDGTHASFINVSSSVNAVTGTMIAALGGLVGPLSGSTDVGKGWGNIVSASFDEFRYWKIDRGPKEIGRYCRDQVGGGTNTDNVKYDDITNKVTLGVYYKFNEGITGVSSTDSVVLDYSGRISNGEFVNYSSTCRNTGSAIVDSGFATKEFLDPIVYLSHPDVASLADKKKISGSHHDHENSVSLYKSLPGWILEEDEEGYNNLKYLTQIIGSYFDDLYLQIQSLPRIKDINYPDDNFYEKPLPFAERLLSGRGYIPPELLADASNLSKYLDRDEKIIFEKKLHEVKNIIYQNIYNNLSYIQKSKGTYKSMRNFLRCFGVDEELVKLNIYSKNDIYELKDNETHTTVRKKYLDFDDLETRYTASGYYTDSYTANAYQYYDSTDSNSISYIPAIASADFTGSGPMMTIEAEVFFPKRSIVGDKNYQMFPSTESSIFGLHAVVADNEDLSFDTDDSINFNIVASKPDNDLRNVKFSLKKSGASVFTEVENATSYTGVYDNEKWNIAFRLRPTKARADGRLVYNNSQGFFEPTASAYTYEIYGVNYISNILQNEFTLSGTLSLEQAETFFTKPKRIFLGALRTNFTGSVERYSDVKVSSTRVWLDYLPNSVIKSHAKNADSHGTLKPYDNLNNSLNTNYIPQMSSLILNWTMNNVTGSDTSGQFLIQDNASGSIQEKLKFGDGWSQDIGRYNYAGRGDNFVSASAQSEDAVDLEFLHSSKLKLPEIANSDDMIKILDKQDDVVFTRDTTYVQHLLSVEKSMYQTISEEMLKLFASTSDFNNLIGEPINRYRMNYKKIEKLRELFFESVENTSLDLEKFIQYFKWIDDAVTIMIAQLLPASSNTVELLRNMVESHILERNKYYNKFPTLEIKPHNPIGQLRGIEELKYNWKFGHAPINPNEITNQDESCLWWKQRAERDDVLSSGNDEVDSNKSVILKTAITEVTGAEDTLLQSDGSRYAGPYYAKRSLARPIEVVSRKSLKLKAGSNPENNNLHDFYKNVIKWGSDDDFIYLDVDNEIKKAVCNDQVTPPELNKKEFRMKALTMEPDETINEASDKEYTDAKSNLILPFSMYSASIETGYIKGHTGSALIDFTNLHDDKYGYDAEIPMQGPFAEKHVGGMQHRHVKLNIGDDVPTTRPEGWHLQKYLTTSDIEYFLTERFTNATSTPTTDVTILDLPPGSTFGDPSEYEYWRNGETYGVDNAWTFFSGTTPTAGTGPERDTGDFLSHPGYAYCEVSPTKVGQTFGLVTPLIDFLDTSQDPYIRFKYHMYGLGIGTLKVQISGDEDFVTDVEDVVTFAGQQHLSASADWSTYLSSIPGYKGRRFFIRFLYTATTSYLGDCAIDDIEIYDGASATRNSFKLLSPTHDNHHRPSAVWTRGVLAKRPVNIRNIKMTGSSPTVAGNYLDRYEYVNTTSPEGNDPWFVDNAESLNSITAETLNFSVGNIAERLRNVDDNTSHITGSLNFTMLDRTWLISGSERNRTRFKTRFSSPGGFEVMSRGFLDPQHEIYSAYNAMTWRNNWGRKVYNSRLQAHCGRFGVSAHSSSLARVYDNESTGQIQAENYELVGDAATHKTHRNSKELMTDDGNPFIGATNVYSYAPNLQYTGSGLFGRFNEAQGLDHLRNTGSTDLWLDTFTFSAWIRFDEHGYGLTSEPTTTSKIYKERHGRIQGIIQLGSWWSNPAACNDTPTWNSGYRAFVLSGSSYDSGSASTATSRKIGYMSKFGHKIHDSDDGTGVAGFPGYWVSDAEITAGQWHHIAMSADEVSGTQGSAATPPTFWIDGEKVGTTTVFAPSGTYIMTQTTTGLNKSSSPHYIGRSEGVRTELSILESFATGSAVSDGCAFNSVGYLAGDLAEVAIFNDTLTDDDVAVLASVRESDGFVPDLTTHPKASRLVAWYRMGHGAPTAGVANDGPDGPGHINNIAYTGSHYGMPSMFNTADNQRIQIVTASYAGAGATPGMENVASGTYTDPVFEVKSDNAFITHAIPRTEAQYRWIASSIDSGSIPETGKQI